MKVNGKVEMCGMNKGTWIRVKGAVKEDTRREARVAMMEANKNALQSMYTVDDNLMTVFVLKVASQLFIHSQKNRRLSICKI